MSAGMWSRLRVETSTVAELLFYQRSLVLIARSGTAQQREDALKSLMVVTEHLCEVIGT